MVFFSFVATTHMVGQEVTVSQKKLKVQRYTLIEQFEPDMVLSAENRLAIKKKRKEDTERKLMLINTMNISERKRKKLLKELLQTPYSKRLTKATNL